MNFKIFWKLNPELTKSVSIIFNNFEIRYTIKSYISGFHMQDSDANEINCKLHHK